MNGASRSRISCIPGFLGLPSDWDLLKTEADFAIDAVDLWRETLLRQATCLPDLGRALAERARGAPEPEKSILLGYSLGSRAALHALLSGQAPWRAAVIVSAHPGLKSEEEREQRRRSDHAWAERFLAEPWPTLLAAWNDQSVFHSSSHISGGPGALTLPPRREDEFDRVSLAYALRAWSLGTQEDLEEPLSKLRTPLLWVSGASDEKFSVLAERVARRNPFIRAVSVPGAGHRVPWEKPAEFRSIVRSFVKEHV